MSEHDEGETLVEMLVAVVILGITGVAFTGALYTMTVTSSYHREQSSGGTVLRSYAEAVTADTYRECGATYPATTFTAVSGFTESTTVTFWKSDNNFYASGATGSPCPAAKDNGLQRVLVTVTSTNGRDIETLSVFKRRRLTGDTS